MTIVVGIDTDAGQGGVVAHERTSLRKIDQKLGIDLKRNASCV